MNQFNKWQKNKRRKEENILSYRFKTPLFKPEKLKLRELVPIMGMANGNLRGSPFKAVCSKAAPGPPFLKK